MTKGLVAVEIWTLLICHETLQYDVIMYPATLKKDLLIVYNHPAMFSGGSHFKTGDITHLVCHATLQDYEFKG